MLMRAVEPISPLEILRQENEILKETIADATIAVATLENALERAGIAVPSPGHGLDTSAILAPEDYWSPAIEVPPGSAYIEEYGALR